MSDERDERWSRFERLAMQRALELAAQGVTTTQPNPRVGCVIARDEQIVGEGWHERSGEPHAEVFALREAGERARGATAYVTLEPCNHHGRTPPCTEALIAAGVAKVIFACGDPNPRVDGSGAARLRAAGIGVETGLLAEEGEELNVGFFKRMRTGRPWLRLKLATSLDGRTALSSGESKWITSPEAREDVHRFRAESAAILSTSATVIADDPELTARPAFEPSLSASQAGPSTTGTSKKRLPLRVILDRHLRIPSAARVFATQGEIIRLTSATAAASSANAPGRIEVIASEPDGHLSLAAALAWMGGAGLNEVWTEAGPTLAGALLGAQLVDELVLYMAPRLLGPDARPLAHLAEPLRLADSPEWRIHDLRQTGPDIRIMLRPNR